MYEDCLEFKERLIFECEKTLAHSNSKNFRDKVAKKYKYKITNGNLFGCIINYQIDIYGEKLEEKRNRKKEKKYEY